MALVNCSECGRSISDKAAACPQCGAPGLQNAEAAAVSNTTQQNASVQGGTTCPFSGHQIPDGAIVCVCGAYYGYKGGVLTDQKFGLLLKLVGLSVLMLVLGYLFGWDLVTLLGGAGTLIFGVVFFALVLPIRIQGKKWWREI